MQLYYFCPRMPDKKRKRKKCLMRTHQEQFLEAACPVCQAALSVASGINHVLCPYCGAIVYVPDAVTPGEAAQVEGAYAYMEESTKN